MASRPIVSSENSTEEITEKQYVHDVYEAIAPHFSQTRYKPWPVIQNFLLNLPAGSIGADVGCGNGKYLNVNNDLYLVGSDRSSKLIDICASRGFEVMTCDASNLPYRKECFDFVMSVAVIHHFTTAERRLAAIKQLFRIARPGAQILIYVWALEQTGSSRRQFDPENQDVFVPWAMPVQKTTEGDVVHKEIVYQRYYHLFKKGELEDLVSKVDNAQISQSGYDRDNWFVIAKKVGQLNT